MDLWALKKMPAEWIDIDETVERVITGTSMWNSDHRLLRFAAFYSKMDEYFRKEKHTDVNIICEGNVFKCHRTVLAAASEYFHSKFCDGNFTEDVVVLQDIDSFTFQQILLYVYRGEIAAINDDNVFNMLRSSHILKLNEIEEFCVRYLTEKNIPMDRALEIYLFASASKKVSLIPAISEFVLEHLDRFSGKSVFLNMSSDEFRTLLTHFRASSSTMDREKRILNTILKWVFHWTNNYRDRRSLYFVLALKPDFKFVSAEYVSDYFDSRYSSVDTNDENNRSEASDGPDFDSSVENNESSLHVYAKTRVPQTLNGPARNEIISIAKLEENDNWQLTHHATSPPIEMVRVIDCDGRLYSMKLCENEWTFSSSTAIDLWTDEKFLATPSVPKPEYYDSSKTTWRRLLDSSPNGVLIDPLISLTRLDKSIYYTDILHNLQSYNIDLDVWSPIPQVNEKCRPLTIASDDTRLYIIGSRKKSSFRHFMAYDPRAGEVDVLPNAALVESLELKWPTACHHKGRIYAAEYHRRPEDYRPKLGMAMFDLAAGRWDYQKMDCRFVSRQFVSVNNRLFKLEFEHDHIYAQVFDSYLQTWDNSYGRKLLDVTSQSISDGWSFQDAVAFHS